MKNAVISLSQAVTIAKTSLLVHIRQRLPFILVIFGVLVLVAVRGVSTLGVEMQERFFVDISLGLTTMLGAMMCLMVSFEELIKEKEKGTLQFVLAGPVSRGAFYGGKLMGILMSNFSALLIMGLASWLAAITGNMTLPSIFWLALLFTWLRLAILAGAVLLLSLFLSRALTVAVSLFFFLYAHGEGFVVFAARTGGADALARLIGFINFFLPDLSLLSLGTAAVHGGTPAWSYISGAVLYGVSITIALYLLGVALFDTQDL